MKKFFLIILILSVLLLSGCRVSESFGVIGGADGPTSVYVSQKDDFDAKSERYAVRTVKIDGALYYDTGEDSEQGARCATLDGNFTKGANEFEIPQNDNQANFDGAQGYQIGKENTIEIPIEDEWEIFKKIGCAEENLAEYKYIIKVEGITPYSIEEKEFVVLTNNMDITVSEVDEYLRSPEPETFDIYVAAVL